MLNRNNTLNSIEEIVLLFLNQLNKNIFPKFEIISRKDTNVYYDEENSCLKLNNNKIIKSIKYDNGISYTRMWKILESCYCLLLDNRSVTQREIYYIYPTVIFLM